LHNRPWLRGQPYFLRRGIPVCRMETCWSSLNAGIDRCFYTLPYPKDEKYRVSAFLIKYFYQKKRLFVNDYLVLPTISWVKQK
jgi:hypothetical protein